MTNMAAEDKAIHCKYTTLQTGTTDFLQKITVMEIIDIIIIYVCVCLLRLR